MEQAAATGAAAIVVGRAIEVEATQEAEITLQEGASTTRKTMAHRYDHAI